MNFQASLTWANRLSFSKFSCHFSVNPSTSSEIGRVSKISVGDIAARFVCTVSCEPSILPPSIIIP